MSVPPSDSPTRTHAPVEGPLDPATLSLLQPAHAPGLQTLSLPPVAASRPDQTPPFDGPGSPATFPTPDERYTLLSFIARGGMGEVHTARDRVLNREVAVKVLRDDLKDREFVASRFIEEARITGKLQHPGIPPVHDLDKFRDGRPFIAMKLIKGRTLSDLLAKERPDLPELLRIFDHVCQAVAYAHDRRVIHRDLKPGNVMVGAFNEVQVMDWGLAKVLGEGPLPVEERRPADTETRAPVSVIESDRDPSSHTRAGSLLGTPAYMPPEQAKGEVDRTDTRSDVFALGAMLCELLTGLPPYWAATSAEIQALALTVQLGPAFERLASCDADPDLTALAKRCLSPNPDDRPGDAGQVAKEVAAYRSGVEERLHRAERDRAAAEAKAAEEINTRREIEAREAERRKRRRTQLALAAAGVLLVLGAGLGAWWTDKQAAEKQAELDRSEAQRTADALARKVEQEQRTARNVHAIETLLGQVETALQTDDAEKAAGAFAQIEKRLIDGGVEPIADRIARARTDLEMLRDLDRTDELLWTAEEYRVRSKRSIAAWAEAFRKYGIDLEKTPTADAAQRIAASQLRERLLLALDLWWLHHTEGRRPPELRALLKAADPDPFRNEFRAALQRGDRGWNTALMEDEEALRQPARFAAVIGQAPGFPTAGRERVLRPALERSPGDFSLILTMITVYESETTFRLETANQQLRWAQAAVSVRPGSKIAWRNLGRAYWDKGQIDDAVRCYKKAVRLDDKDYNSWTQLCAVLLRKHDPETAKDAAERALALNPDYSLAHNNLGSVFERMGRYEDSLREFELGIEIDAKYGVESHMNFNNRGYARLRLGNYNGAINDFQQALRLRSDFRLAETNLNYARELRKGGRMPEEAPEPRPAPPR